MKIKPEYKLREVSGMNIVVSTAGMDFQGIITVNETAKFIWRMLEKGAEKDEIISSLAKECNVTAESISADVDEFITTLERADIIE
ncbi:MAG: PqqD family protein [Clostridia bacterium]|nr:PqqD family protein [Clostridia bacterium]